MRYFSTENSQRISSMTWDQSVLRVEFKRGGIYEYPGVPEEIFDTLIQAQSLGNAFNDLVKGKYPYEKIG